ncbi:MAG: 30S ribosomal protein S3 [Nanoarchaeota archaeon]
MIERQIISQKLKEQQIKDYIYQFLNKASYSHTEIQRTPLGERILIYTSKPGLVVGRKGTNIVDLTSILKERFGLENPQIEVVGIENPNLNAQSVAKRIVTLFERFGSKRFKAIGYKILEDILAAGAIGAEIVMSGRGLPSSRAKSWRFKAGYLKKSGDVAQSYVTRGFASADLVSGCIGIRVSILKPDVKLPDRMVFRISKEAKPNEAADVSEKNIASKQETKEEKKEFKEEKKEKKPRKRVQKTANEDGNNKKE